MEILTIDQIKLNYPDEWVLLRLEESQANTRPEKGSVLLHGKDYLEICYKGSEIAKDFLTTLLFTGTTTKNRKWLKSIRLNENPKTI